jgi:glycosyltransferase involved in cell wall biosynthesis
MRLRPDPLLQTAPVSVVIAAWDAESRIREAIISLSNQSLRPREVIVVDDASQDATSEVAELALKEFSLPGQVLKQETNCGPSRARNVGWRNASCPWIQFLDDDDELHPNKLQWQAQAVCGLEREAGFAYSAWALRETDKSGFSIDLKCDPHIVGDDISGRLSSLLADGNFAHLASGLVSRYWLEKVGGFDERHRLIEDVDLQIRLMAEGARYQKISVPEPVFYYKRRPDSISSTRRKEYIEGILRNAKLAHLISDREMGEYTVLEDVMRSAFGQAIVFYASNDRQRFEAIFAEAQPFFKGGHRHGSRAFGVLVKMTSWRRAELLAASLRCLKYQARLTKLINFFLKGRIAHIL